MFWLFLPTLVAAGFFSDHYEKYLDDTVDPCDDFYDHVCGISISEKRFFETEAIERFQNVMQQVTSPKIRDLHKLINHNLENFPEPEIDEEVSKAFDKFTGNQSASHCRRMSMFFSDSAFLKGIEAYEGYYRIQSTPHWKTLKKKITDIFTVLKDLLTSEFSEAPWTQRYPELVNFLKNVTLFDLQLKDLQLEKHVEEIEKTYLECLGITTKKSCSLAGACSAYSICPIKRKLYGDLKDVEFFLKHSAEFDDEKNIIKLFPSLYTLDEEDLPYMLGAIDFVISHEIGHVFFRPGGAVPANSDCLRKHMQKTCFTHVNSESCIVIAYREQPVKLACFDSLRIKYAHRKKECTQFYEDSGNTTAVKGNYSRLVDDAADWVGMHAGLKTLRNYFPTIFTDPNPENIKIAKKFFYATAMNFCSSNSKTGDKDHSSYKVRTNGILSMFPEFSEVFQCKRGDKMAKAATCLPFAGVGAPTRKRSQIHR